MARTASIIPEFKVHDPEDEGKYGFAFEGKTVLIG